MLHTIPQQSCGPPHTNPKPAERQLVAGHPPSWTGGPLTVAAAHGGTISVESEPGQGAAFHVRLPLYLAERQHPACATR
jgi:hypothetical protein